MHQLIIFWIKILLWLYWRVEFLRPFIVWLFRRVLRHPYQATEPDSTAKNTIGFHTGGAPNMTGWGDYVRALDALGVPCSLMSVGGNGLGDIIAQWENGSTVDHTAVIRYMPIDGGEDVPRYDMAPADAVQHWLNWYVPLIGDDVKRHHTRVITKHGNELDKNRIEWLAQFYELLHPALLERMGWQSHRIVCFSFAAGEPEPEQWESILPFLELCGRNPDKWIIGIHEYSYSSRDIHNGGGSLIGRFKWLYDICDSNNIPRPHLVLHEWGWELGTAAQPVEQAIRDIDEIAAVYAMYPTLIGAGIWTLQAYNNTGLKNYIQQLIAPVTNLTIQNDYPCCDEPEGEPPPGDSTEEKIFLLGQSWAFPLNMDAALQAKMIPDGYFPTGEEQWHVVDGMQYAMQPAAGVTDSDDKRTYYAVVGEWGNVMWVDKDSGGTEPPGDFRFTHWPTDYRVVTQRFGANPDLYAPFNLPGHDGTDVRAPHGTPVYAVAAGVISDYQPTDDGHNYGIRIRIDHGGGYETTYAHCDCLENLPVGTRVHGGQLIARADNTGNSFGSHLHLTLKRKNAPAFVDKCGNVWPYDIIDSDPYLAQFDGVSWPAPVECEGETPPIDPPPTGTEVDMWPYFMPSTSVYRGDIVIKKTSWGAADVREQVLEYDGDSWVTKGNTVEIRTLSGDFIKLTVDTSPREGVLYTVESDTGWLPSFFREGQDFVRSEVATFYNYGQWGQPCQPTGEVLASTNIMRFKKLYQSYQVPESGLVFNNVVHLQWILNGAVEEEYWLAPGLAYIRWHSVGQGRTSWAHEVIPWADQAPNETTGTCANPPKP